MPHTEDSDIPRLVRKLLEEAKTSQQPQAKQEKLRLRFLVGGDQQWEADEIARRQAKDRPYITINECEPPVNKVVNGIENNPSGPECIPVGGGADKDTADVMAGMLRQIEYDSMAHVTYTAQARYLTAAGRGVLEWGTDWASDFDCSQKIVIKPPDDPALYFCDPSSRQYARQDAMWWIKLKSLSRSAYESLYGPDRAVLKIGRARQMAGGISAFIGMPNELASIHEWTGGGSGPFFVAEFWRKEAVKKTLSLYSDLNFYRDDEAPEGLEKIKRNDGEGQVVSRDIITHKVTKYVVDACELLGKPVEFITDDIPIIPALGPEIYIDGKLHRLSLIHNMIDPQRALNFTSSSAVEVAGLVPLSPMIGAEGQFTDEKWATMNTEVHAFLEYTPVLMANEEQPEASQWAPPPQRNMWNAAIEWLLNLAGFQKQSLQETSQTYDESLGKNRGDQSGEAVRALQIQSQMGNSHYVAALNTAKAVMYAQIIKAMTKVYDGPRAQTIIRADSQHEIALINQEFAHPSGGENEDGSKRTKRHDLTIGQYSVRVTTGPDQPTRDSAAIDALSGIMKANPQAFSQPPVLAAVVRLLGQGNPKLEQIADMISPDEQGEEKPEAIKAQLQQTKAQLQQVTQVAQRMGQEIQAKLPQIEAQKWGKMLDSLTKIRVAEISASKDADNANADREASLLESMIGLAHDAGMQSEEHEHQADQTANSQQFEASQADQTQSTQE